MNIFILFLYTVFIILIFYFNLFLYLVIYFSLCQFNGNNKDLSVSFTVQSWTS